MYYTYISKKQIGVIFSNWKRGNISLSEEHIKWLYDHCCEVKGYINNNAREDVLHTVKCAIDHIFSGEYAEAEEEIGHAFSAYHHIYA